MTHKHKHRGLHSTPTATNQALGDMEEKNPIDSACFGADLEVPKWVECRGKLQGFLCKQIPVTPMRGRANNRQALCFFVLFFQKLWLVVSRYRKLPLVFSYQTCIESQYVCQSGWSRMFVLFRDILDKTLQVDNFGDVNWKQNRIKLRLLLHCNKKKRSKLNSVRFVFLLPHNTATLKNALSSAHSAITSCHSLIPEFSFSGHYTVRKFCHYDVCHLARRNPSKHCI